MVCCEMTAPDFSRQHGDIQSAEEGLAWFRQVAAEFKNDGAVWLQFAVNPDQRNVCLVEGWRARPIVVPLPAFHMTYEEPQP